MKRKLRRSENPFYIIRVILGGVTGQNELYIIYKNGISRSELL